MTLSRNWQWKIHWYRQAELDGALLLGRMVRAAADTNLIASLTRHCADEARHSMLWAKAAAELQVPAIRIARSYQSFYVGQGAPPASLVEVLALTHVFEHRVDRQFREELDDPSLPPSLRRTLQALIRDEQDHLAWVRDWLHTQPNSQELLDRYWSVDRRVYEMIAPLSDETWNIPGIGTEAT